MPPAQGHPGSPHDPQALGMTNKAQQVASEAVVVSWCESVGYSARGDNGYGYAGVFQMGEAEAARWIPGYQPGTGMRDDPIANTLGAANYYFAGHGNPAAWDGWSPWAVVWTDYGGPNDHVVVPVLPRFASTDMDDNGNGTSYFGQFGPELPRWAVNPFVDGIVPTSYGGAPCGVAIGDGQPHTWPSQPDFAHVGAPTGEVLETLQPTAAGVVCPVPGTTDFYNDWAHARGGGSRPHTGTDVFADEGAPIVAPGDGTIEYVKNTNTGNSGLSVAILLDNGMRWVFVHNSGHPPGLAGGARVAAGETIGYIGRTGNAATTPPHAHTELRLDGRQSPKVNPYHYLADACPNAGGMPFAHPPMYLIDLLPEHGAVREMPWPDGQA